MTKKQFKDLGFIESGSDRMYLPEIDITIRYSEFKKRSLFDFVKYVWTTGFEYGQKSGAGQLADKIKILLQIDF